MDSPDDNLPTENCVASVTTVVNVDVDVVQVKENKKVRRRKRKPKVNGGFDTTDDAGCSVESSNARHTLYNESSDLEELLVKMVNLNTLSVTKTGGVNSTTVNDSRHIAENGILNLPSTSEGSQAKVKKQNPKKKKVKNVNVPPRFNNRTKGGVDTVSQVLEFLEDYSSGPDNGTTAPSVLEELIGTIAKSSVKRKQKKRPKKKNVASSEADHSVETTPKKSSHKSATVVSSKKKQEQKQEKVEEHFEEYFSEEQVMAGLQEGVLISGVIRINQRNYKEAYISSPCGEEKDIVISGLKDRNRSLEGDEVVVMLYPDEQLQASESAQKNGKVVYIKDYVHPRLCVGHLLSKKKKLNKYVVFSPKDSRIPRLKIPVSTLPEEYINNPNKYDNIIFQAKISKWTEVTLAEGVIVGMVGPAGELEVETVALLLDNNIDARPYPEDFRQYYPAPPFVIPEEEFCKREDLRHECIFTIDPLTAKDLDDAVSLKNLPNGNFEVGVHISDVSYFVHHNTPLDIAVRNKATSVYLVQRVYHMLPDELCMICSLTPGQDKLAFSVIYEITPDAQVISHRFARSIIRSCTKFAYEHAQAIIDNPDKEWTSEDFPPICNGFGPKDCVNVIKNLYKLSVIMRQRRYDNGALRIDQPKLYFELDPDTGIPIKWHIYEQKEANRLIEEFMLLANGTVAEHIYNVYPNIAFLRSHERPPTYSLKVLADKLSLFGIHLDVETAGGIHSSLMKYESFESNDVFSWARKAVLNNLCAKGMKRALYICANGNDLSHYHHYALNVPFYTHFTSPIRRYADIMVHRLLAASLGMAPKPTWTKEFTAGIARNCNIQKNSAKVAGEQSSLLYLTLFLSHKGPITTYAAVIDVKDHSFDVILYECCTTLRIYTDKLEAETTHSCNGGVASLEIKWNCGRVQVIQLFSVVPVVVHKHEDMLKLEGKLIPPPPMPTALLKSSPSNRL